MKKNKLLLFALFALMGNSLYAQLATGDYFLINVATGKGVNFAKDNGYIAVLADHPHVLTITNNGSTYSIGGHHSKNYLIDAAGSYASAGAAFTITAVDADNSIYTISKDGGSTFLGYDGSNVEVAMSLSDGTSDNAKWYIKTRSQLISELSSATETDPIDATFLIYAAGFNRHDGDMINNNVWQGSFSTDHTGFCEGMARNQCAFFFNDGTNWSNGAFDVYQLINDAPTGKYLLKCQGFYRYGSNTDGTKDYDYSTGTSTPGSVLYANEESTPLKSFYSARITDSSVYTDVNLSTSWYRGINFGGTTYYFPYISGGTTNTKKTTAPCAAFDYGEYAGNEVEFTLTGSTLRLGVKTSTNKTYEWTCFDNFELYYLGPLQDLTPFKDQYYALRTKIQDLFIDQTTVYTDEDGAVLAYNSAKSAQDAIVESATSEQEITDAKAALWAAAVTFLKSVTVNDGKYFDMTSFMVNPEVAPSTTTTAEGWTASKNLEFGDYQITQFPGGSSDPHFNMYQMLANMPAGQYTLKARGFYSPGARSTDMTGVSNTEVPVLLYINETTQPLLNICADGSSTQLSKGYQTSVNGATLYVPNSRSHLQAFYDAGHYWNEMPVVVGEDGNLTIGLKYDAWVSSGWGVISDFHLYYSGALDLSAWQEQLALVVSQAQSLVIPTLPKRRLTEVIQQNNKTYTTVEDYQTAIANINAAIAVAEPYVEPYAQFKTMRQMVQERFISQTDVYTDNDGAADAYNSQLTTINSAVENVTSVEALETQKSNLWNAALTFMKSVSINEGQGFDLTWMIGDPDFNDANYKNYWTETLASSTTIGVVGGTNKVLRYYNSSFDLSQVLPYTLPAGAYRMKVDGFERTNDPKDTAWADYQAGNSVVTGAIYLNANEQLVKNLFDDQSVTSDVYGGVQPSGASFYIPDCSTAASQYLSAGLYVNTLIGVLAADGPVTIGYRCANIKAWTVVDNFRLEYIGEAPQVALANNANENVAVCAPFTLSASDEGVEGLYAIAGMDDDAMKLYLYSVESLPAGTPGVAMFNVANYSAPIEMTLSDGKNFVMPWEGGFATTDAAHYTWNYTTMMGGNISFQNLRTLEIVDYNDMNFDVNLENLAARRYLDMVKYSGSEDASLVAAYNVAPPTRRDIPNAVMIPVPSHDEDAVITVYNEYFDELATVTVPAGVSEGYVYNLLPQQTYFYNVEEETGGKISSGEFHTKGYLRMVYAPSAYNIRDLGGWDTQDDCRTTYGHLFRGSTLNGYVNCTPEDIQALKDLGIGGEIDLRYREDYDKDMGCGTSAFGFGADDYFFAAANDWTAANLNDTGTRQRLKQEFDFILEHFRQGKAVYYHCAWGADRTGMLSFLMEGVLGLTIDQIYKDYELTSFSAAPGATNRLKTSFQDRIDVILALDGATLRDKFENYFINKLGISYDDITYFRSVMLERYPLRVDEDATLSAHYNGEADITLHRTLKAGMHNTVVLPCNFPLWKAQCYFGGDTKMEKITAYDDVHDVLVTEEIEEEAPANTPFLLIPSTVSNDNTYFFDAVHVVEGELKDAEFTGGKLVGSYAASTVINKSDNPTLTNYVISNDRFYFIDSTPATMKGTRAYLVLNTPTSGAKSVVTFGGGIADGIETLTVDDLSNAAVYDLSGRRISKPARGLYIVNGKKVMVK